MKAAEIINYLLRLSDAKLVLIKALFNLTEEQGEALETDKMEVLDQLIQQKQSTMDKIDVLDREFVEKFQILKNELGIEDLQEIENQDLPGFKELKEKVLAIMAVVEKIHLLDDEHTEKLKKDIVKVKHSLQTIKTGQKAVTGYNSQYKETHSIFMDKKK